MSLPRSFLSPLLATLLAILASPSARAEGDETPVKDADVPKAVVDAVAKKYPGSVVKRWAREEEDKKVAYEAKVEITTKDEDGKESTRRVESTLTAEGKILVEEEIIPADALPDALKKAIAASAYAKAVVQRVERTIIEEKVDATQYEILFELDGKKAEVTFDAAGKLIEEEKADEAEKPAAGMDEKPAKPDAPMTPPK